MPDTLISIDLSSVQDLLRTALGEVNRLHDTDLPSDTDGVRSNRTEVAEVSRDLLYLADALQAASVLVKNEYWHVKGRRLVQ